MFYHITFYYSCIFLFFDQKKIKSMSFACEAIPRPFNPGLLWWLLVAYDSREFLKKELDVS